MRRNHVRPVWILLASLSVSACGFTDGPRSEDARAASNPSVVSELSAAPVEDDVARPAPLNVDSSLVPLDSQIKVTPALRRSLEDAGAWFEERDRLTGVRRDLNGDGRSEVAVLNGCGSSGACVATVFTEESADRLRLLLVAGTLEEGLFLASTSTNGWPDLLSHGPPFDVKAPGPPPYRFVYDGTRYLFAR